MPTHMDNPSWLRRVGRPVSRRGAQKTPPFLHLYNRLIIVGNIVRIVIRIVKIQPIKIRPFIPPQDNLEEVLSSGLKNLKENTIVAIASKIVSIGEGRCVPTSQVKDKDKLIIGEAEKYLPRDYVPGKWVMHTLKNNLYMPSAGIDESNANGYYILWPENPTQSAQKIWQFLRRKFNIKNLGIIITDSHSVPLRRGVIGISLAHWGFAPLKDYRGTPDIFGKELVFSQSNIPDGLAAAAVAVMGEGDEQTPLVVISDAPFIKFTPRPPITRKPHSSFVVDPTEDLYQPFFFSVKWRRGGQGKKGTKGV